VVLVDAVQLLARRKSLQQVVRTLTGLAAVEFQLSQLYYGVHLALALQRTLILPKVRPNLAKLLNHIETVYNWARISQLPYRSHMAAPFCTQHRCCSLPAGAHPFHVLQMACFCDNNWWPGTGCRSVPTAEDGADPHDFPLPFACPFDNLFIAQACCACHVATIANNVKGSNRYMHHSQPAGGIVDSALR
jgi:hypothetical protein